MVLRITVNDHRLKSAATVGAKEGQFPQFQWCEFLLVLSSQAQERNAQTRQ